MSSQTFGPKFNRRSLVKGAAALGAFQVASPFLIQARGETPIRIGMIDPLTGVYAAPAGNEVMGAKLAIEHINAKGGILGRHAAQDGAVEQVPAQPPAQDHAQDAPGHQVADLVGGGGGRAVEGRARP